MTNAPSRLRVGAWLSQWLRSTEQDWHTRVDDNGLEQGWYGTGYVGWGMQANLQYFAAATAVAKHAEDPATRDWALRRALCVLRYIVSTHVTGVADAEDGRRWGRTWISVLGLERAAWALDEMRPRLDAHLGAALDALLIDEAEWQSQHHERNQIRGIHGSRWDSDKKNWPESNLWNGVHLWRTAARYPEHPRAAAWREAASRFMINAVSVGADATSDTVLDGLRVGDVHRGANFFDSYALDHHGYLNVGYMIICVSNAAFALLDLTAQGHELPEALLWHQPELWQRLRPLIGPDARLIRIGGDTRVRYAYCQEYVLPALMLAQRALGDPGAGPLIDQYLAMVERERGETDDGLLYGRRLAPLAAHQPYYRARLECDRAAVLASAWHHMMVGTVSADPEPADHEPTDHEAAGALQEPSTWSDDEHGFAFVRGVERVASVSWRAASRTQILALPSDRPDMAEWSMNLNPVMRFEGDGVSATPTEATKAHRSVAGYLLKTFPGGFLSLAKVAEGQDLAITEGWRRDEPVADSWVAVAALPDDATVIGLHLCRARRLRPPLLSAHALNLLIPDDVHNDARHFAPRGDKALTIDDRLDVVADAPLSIASRPVDDRSGLRSIGVQQVCAGARHGRYWAAANEMIMETAWAVRIRRPGDDLPHLLHESTAQGVHEVTVSVPSGQWRLTVDPDGQGPSTWGEGVGTVSLTQL